MFDSRGRRRLVKSIVHDLSRPLHEDLGDGKEASTLDGVWEAANPIHPLTGLCSLRDDMQHDEGNNINKSSTLDSSTASKTANTSTSGGFNELSSQQEEGVSQLGPSSVSLELFLHMLEHGASSLGLGHICHEGLWEFPLFLLEKSYTPPKLRQALTEILFEQMQVPKLFIAKDAVMACYAVGKTTGIVVDIGGLGTTVSPVHEGWVEGRGILRSPIGGDAMSTLMLQKLDQIYNLQQQNKGKKPPYVMPGYQVRTVNYQMRKPSFHRLARLDLAHRVTASIAAVADYGYDASIKSKAVANESDTLYELPDGTRIKIPSQTKYEFGELLFGRDEVSASVREGLCSKQHKSLSHHDLFTLTGGNPSVTGVVSNNTDGIIGSPSTDGCFHFSAAPIQNMICDAAFRCDRDQQAQLLGNVIVTGGGACMPNLTERIRDEVELMIHTHTPGWRVKVLSPDFRERSVGSWIGGSIVASLPTFSEMWMTKAEYDEYGAALVNRKCP
jgi:actin-related protein